MSPELTSIQNCDLSLNFHPKSHWPEGLPAVAINHLVIAGFEQKLAFNHKLDTRALDYPHQFAQLFRSLYPDLAAAELAEIWKLGSVHKDFPVTALFESQHVRMTEQTLKLCEIVSNFPSTIKSFLIEKRLSFGDLQPLLSFWERPDLGPKSLSPPRIEFFFTHMQTISASRSITSQAFELWVEVSLMGLDLEKWNSIQHADEALRELKVLRYPETSQRDETAKQIIRKLPLPGHAQARWMRQGDQSGIELKLFVSNPSDCKKWIMQLQDLEQHMKNLDLWGGH